MRTFTTRENVESHAHTVASVNDAVATFMDYFEKAKNDGFSGLAITNHGNVADLVEAWSFLKEHDDFLEDFKFVFGVEGYLKATEHLYMSDKLTDEEKELVSTALTKTQETQKSRQHLVLLVKNNEGYQDFCRYISDTERDLELVMNKKFRFPLGSMELLEKHFKGKNGVICSSACIAGPLAYELLYNHRIDKEIASLEEKSADIVAKLGDDFFEKKSRCEDLTTQIDALTEENKNLKPIATKKFKKAQSKIDKETDETLRATLQEELDIEIVESKEAADKIEYNKKAIESLKATRKPLKEVVDKKKTSLVKLENNAKFIAILEKNKRTESELYDNAKAVTEKLIDIFGKDNFYIELMYHGLDQEAYVMPILAKIAVELDVKTIATNDAHMANKEDYLKREYVRDIPFIGADKEYEYASETDKELYLKTAEEKYDALCKVVDEETAYESIINARDMFDTITFEGVNSYGKHYPEFKDADESLRELAVNGKTTAELLDGRKIEIVAPRGGIASRYGKEWSDKHNERFEYEMKIISQMGFSSYFLFISDVINKCKSKFSHISIGPGRGSGAGSIVCYLSQITELEPLSLNLLFERFLNPSRVSMPK